MQNKGLIKFIAIVFALVSIYQLSFTFVANKIENDAKKFANGDTQKELRYLDSIGNNKMFLGNTYNEIREKKVKKGLDLEGGINVILQINQKDILKTLANNSSNAVFNKSLAEAEATRVGNQTFLDAFYKAFEKNSAGTIKLSSPEVFSNRNLPEVTFDMSNSQVETIIAQKVDEAVESSFRVLRERIDKFGVTSPNIQKIGNSGRILVELPGAKNIDEIKQLLQSTAQLEFWETYKFEEISNFLFAANEQLKKTQTPKETVKIDSTELANEVSNVDKLLSAAAKTTDSTDTKAANEDQPLFNILQPLAYEGSTIVGISATKDTAAVNSVLKRTDIRNLLSGDLRFTKFIWGKISDKDPLTVQLYALKGNRDNKAPLTGSVVIDASDTFDQFSRPAVSMQMNPEGAKLWEELTGKVSNQRNTIAIVLDNTVYSAPGVSTGAISGGRSEITGDFSIQETKIMSNILKSGKMPASADIVQSEIVGPSLGQQAIDYGVWSSIAGSLVIFAWMIIYYGRAGVHANIALIVNLLLLFGILASLGAVLTLPGIAGIVLTIGTAIDANIIIYERAKEELRDGKSLDESVKHAFSWQGALSAITDANVTTALTGIVLLIFGSGPIKGFATTLLIGIATSLFTSIFITRLLLERDVKNNIPLRFYTSLTKNLFTNFSFDFLGKKKIAYITSSIIMIVCIGSLFINGMNEGVDFAGGRTFQVKFDKEVPASEVSNDLSEVFGSNVEAKVFGSKDQLKITTKYKVEEESHEVDQQINKMMYDNLKKYYSSNISYEQFTQSTDDKLFGIVQASKVGPSVAKDVKQNAIWAVLGSLAIVFVYLAISFRKWQYSLGAVAAVAHDVIFVIGVYSLCYKFAPFNMELDQSFVAALLTVIGYSLNDTVIVFDRVREYLNGGVQGSFKQVVNDSINTTLSRTFNTSATVLVVLVIMLIFGGESLRGFVFAMLLGIGVGTYSSLFIATPILADTVEKTESRRLAELQKQKTEETSEVTE